MPNLVADVRELSAGQYVHLVIYGSTAVGDGGGGFYVWNAAATNADDGAAWIKPTSVAVGDPGRWQRVWTLPVLLTAFGQDLIDSADAAAARTALALGTLATLSGVDLTANVSNALPIGNGGTGQVTAADAFTALKQVASETATGVVELATSAEVAIGTDTSRAVTPAGAAARYQPLDADLTALAGLTSAADALPYFTGSGTAGVTTLSVYGRTLIDDANAATAQATLGLGTMATQAASAVTITGGSVTGITDITVADGGTGASTADAARDNLSILSQKGISIENPTATENIVMFFTDIALTVTEIRSVVKGSSPSVTFKINHGSDTGAAGTAVVTAGTTCTNTTTGLSTTSFNAASIGANSFVWLTTSAVSGTVTQLHVTVAF